MRRLSRSLRLLKDHSWQLTAVNRARTWSANKDLLHPVYILTRKGDPFHLQRPHAILEVSWGHRHWVTAVALPKWINNYHCLGLLKNACGPILDHCCAMWCDDTRLKEELVECNIGSFVQVHIETFFSDLTCKQPCNDPSVPCTCLSRDSKITR